MNEKVSHNYALPFQLSSKSFSRPILRFAFKALAILGASGALFFALPTDSRGHLSSLTGQVIVHSKIIDVIFRRTVTSELFFAAA